MVCVPRKPLIRLAFGLVWLSAVLALFGAGRANAQTCEVRIFAGPTANPGVTLNNFYNSLGNNSLLLPEPVGDHDLSSAEVIWIIEPGLGFSSGDIASLTNILSAGKRLVLNAENGGFDAAGNARINALLSALGASISVDSNTAAGPYAATVSNGLILNHPLTSGVNSISVAFPTSLTLGSAASPAILAPSLRAVVASQDLLGGELAVLGDHNIYDGVVFNNPLFDTEEFLLNFLADVCDAVSTVTIDIKPGSFPNSINLASKGVVPVAILGSAIFDASDVDPSTLTLASAGVKMAGKTDKLLCSIEDVSGDFGGGPEGAPDGFLDLVCHFVTVDLGLTDGDTEATLTGMTFGGQDIEGTDSINTVP